MATTRYFKATDGNRTFFRASPSQVYLSLTVDPINGWVMHRSAKGQFPAVEISRQEYVALVALKQIRCAADKAAWEAKHNVRDNGYWGTAPRHSWVRNEVLAEVGA